MPFKSKAQRRFMYAAAAKGEIPPEVVAEFEKATPKKVSLPEKVQKEKKAPKAKVDKRNQGRRAYIASVRG